MSKIIFKGKKKDNYKKILVDLPHGLGDQIMCLPFFKSFKDKYPGSKITVFSPNKSSEFLLKLSPYIDDIISENIKFSYLGILKFFMKNFLRLRKIFKRNNFDLYVVIHYNIIRKIFSIVFNFFSTIINTENVHKIKEVENILNYLNIPVIYDYSIDVKYDKFFLKKFKLKYKKYIVFDIYPQYLDRDPRRWFFFDKLVELLKNDKYAVVLVGLNKNHVEQNNNVIDLVNKTTFMELLNIIQGAKLTVSLDTGIFHFSYCLNTPVVGLFGPVNPIEREPRIDGFGCTIYKNIKCSPCIVNRVDIPCLNKDNLYECMKSISPEEVITEIKKVLD